MSSISQNSHRYQLITNNTMEEFTGLFTLPGEGFVVQLRNDTTTMLYDRQGLQYLILNRKHLGLDATAAEQALAQINSVQNGTELDFYYHSPD